MTKKHFIAIAATIRAQLDGLNTEIIQNIDSDENPACQQAETVEETARRLCDVFTNENPRFDRARFLAACGIN